MSILVNKFAYLQTNKQPFKKTLAALYREHRDVKINTEESLCNILTLMTPSEGFM